MEATATEPVQVIELCAAKSGKEVLEVVQLSMAVSKPNTPVEFEPWKLWVASVIALDDRYDFDWEEAHQVLSSANATTDWRAETAAEGRALANGVLPKRWFMMCPPEVFRAALEVALEVGEEDETGPDSTLTVTTYVEGSALEETLVKQEQLLDKLIKDTKQRKEDGAPKPTYEEAMESVAYDYDLVKRCAWRAKATIPDVIEMLNIRLADKLDQKAAKRTQTLWEVWVGLVISSTANEAITPETATTFYRQANLGKEGCQVRRAFINAHLSDEWKLRIQTAWQDWRKEQSPPAPVQEAETPSEDHTPTPPDDAVDSEPTSESTVVPAPKPVRVVSTVPKPVKDHWTTDAHDDVWHQSHLGMYLRCGLQYQYRYVDGIVRPPALRMVSGTAGHKGVQVDIQSKIDTGELATGEQVKDAVSDEYERRLSLEGAQLDEEERLEDLDKVIGKHKDRAIEGALVYHELVAPKLNPIATERPFRISPPGRPYKLAGAMDIQELSGVRDLKFRARSRYQEEADNSIQLTMYALAVRVLDGELPARVGLDNVVKPPKKGTAFVKTVWSTRGLEDIKRLLRYTDWADSAKKRGDFHPADPTAWCCSPKWCGYWEICPFGAKGRVR